MTAADCRRIYNEKKSTLQECLDLIKSGDVIYTTNTYFEPNEFLKLVHEIADRVENVKIWKVSPNCTGFSAKIHPVSCAPASRWSIPLSLPS